MCTVTLHRNSRHTIITMNRDESRGRSEAPPCRTTSKHGIEALFPLDTVSGGTWLGVNACGVGGCLLNRYGDTHLNDNSEVISRGTIIPALLQCTNLQHAFKLADQLPLHRFRNFDLLLFDENTALQCTNENGVGSVQRRTGEWLMLTSSSWNKAAVLDYRQRGFDEFIRTRFSDAETAESILREFHLQDAGDGRYSVLMRRAESHTKSVSQILLDHKTVTLRYLDEIALDTFAGEPHEIVAGEQISFPRVSAPESRYHFSTNKDINDHEPSN